MSPTLFVTVSLAISLGHPAESRAQATRPAPQITATSPALEERDQPVTADDVAILTRAEALLSNASAWNRADDRECKDDEATGKRSLFSRSRKRVSRFSAATITVASRCRKSASLSRTPLADVHSSIGFETSITFRTRASRTFSEYWLLRRSV